MGKRRPEDRRALQYVFQNPYASLNPRLSIGENVEEPLRFFERSSRKDRRQKVLDALDQVSLGADFADRMPDQLSGGERQRAAVARALIVDPQLLICDEVTSALDVSVQALLVEQLRELQNQRGLTMLFITHNLAVVRSIAQDVIVLQAGRIVEAGTVEQVLSAPQHPYTQQLLADLPRIETAGGRRLLIEQQLGLIHTVARLAPTFAELTEELLPGVGVTVIVDELLLKETVRDGSVGDGDGRAPARPRRRAHGLRRRRDPRHLLVDRRRRRRDRRRFRGAGLPGRSADGRTRGRGRVERRGARHPADDPGADDRPGRGVPRGGWGATVEVVPRLCEGAFDALQSGDAERHDAIVGEELDRLAASVDVVVLAQASMARIAAGRPTGGVPILSSPRSAVEAIAEAYSSIQN